MIDSEVPRCITLHNVVVYGTMGAYLLYAKGGHSDCYGRTFDGEGGRSYSEIVGGSCQALAEKQTTARLYCSRLVAYQERVRRRILGTAIKHRSRRYTSRIAQINLFGSVARLLQRSFQPLCSKLCSTTLLSFCHMATKMASRVGGKKKEDEG